VEHYKGCFMEQLKCQAHIRKFLKTSLNSLNSEITNYLQKQADPPDWQLVWFGNDELETKFWSVFTNLQQELVPQHINSNELYDELWKLYREILLNKKAYETGNTIKIRIEDFTRLVKKPLISFDVIFQLNHLDVGPYHFDIGDVQVCKVTEEFTRENPIFTDVRFQNILSSWKGKLIIKTIVDAADTMGANILGREKIERIINTILVGVRKKYIGMNSDRSFFWEMGYSIVVPKTQTKTAFSEYANFEKIPFKKDLSEDILKVASNKQIWERVLLKQLPVDIQKRIEMAIEWISLAIKELNNDRKIVYLCTALEVLLLPGHTKGLKGEPIAIRQILVSPSSNDPPTNILKLYEKRCSIIHNGELNITLFEQYSYLLNCCIRTLERILYISFQNPGITTLQGLIHQIENVEILNEFLKDYKKGLYESKKNNKIIDEAEHLTEEFGTYKLQTND